MLERQAHRSRGEITMEKVTDQGPMMLVPADEYRSLIGRVTQLEKEMQLLLQKLEEQADSYAFREASPSYRVEQGGGISGETLTAIGFTPRDLLKNLAVYLFEQEVLTLGQAKSVAGMSVADFMSLLGERHIPMHYDVEEFDEDIATLKKLGLLE